MVCKHCNIEIENPRINCPLCHKPLQEGELFPDVKTTKKRKSVTFSLIYLITMLFVSIACFIVNIYLEPEVKWSVSVLGVLLYGYILIAGTIISRRHIGFKILVQIIAIAALAAFIEYSTPNIKWTHYAVPGILCVGGIILGTFSLIAKKPGTYALCLLCVVLAGFGPLIYALSVDNIVLWPSIACASGCLAMFIAVIIFSLATKKPFITGELKRKFHV